MIDDTLISDGSTLEGWQSATEFNPVEVEAYTVRLIAYGYGNKAWIGQLSLDEDMNGVLTGGALRKAIGSKADASWPRSSRTTTRARRFSSTRGTIAGERRGATRRLADWRHKREGADFGRSLSVRLGQRTYEIRLRERLDALGPPPRQAPPRPDAFRLRPGRCDRLGCIARGLAFRRIIGRMT